MSESNRTLLRDLLAQRYEELKRRLTWRLGSAELASDALHDTWVHLEDRGGQSGPVKSPAAYLMRMAMNLAFDQMQRGRRYMSEDEVEAILSEIADPAPGPAQTAVARDEIQQLAALIDAMPARRRAIFLAVRVEEVSHEEAARRFGVSPRLIGLELKRAHEFCMARMPRDP